MVDVSVLTPSLNYARFLQDALISVRDQHQEELTIEHIIQDGLSSDGTIDVIKAFGGVTWASEADRGQSDALNKALEKASGRWIAWLNADEFYLPGGIAHLVRAAERAQVGVAYGDCVFVDEAGGLTRLRAQHRFDARLLKEYGPFIASCSMVFRRDLLEQRAWDPDIRRIMDWDLYTRLMENGAAFRYVPYPVGAFRLHPAQVTASVRESWEAENTAVAARHGRPTDVTKRRRMYLKSQQVHRLYKILDRSYIREVLAWGLKGRDMRWFRTPDAVRNYRQLLDRCYWDRRRVSSRR